MNQQLQRDILPDWYYKLVPPDTPRIIKGAAKWTFIFFAFVGLLMSFKQAHLVIFFVFLLVALLTAASILLAFRLLMLSLNKTNYMKLDTMYRQGGFQHDMALILKNSNPFGAPQERLTAAFLFLMVEDYDAAKYQINPVGGLGMTDRQQALYTFCRMQLFAMTGGMEKAEALFAEQQTELDIAYNAQPELLNTYKPYLDDALAYYMLAAALSQRSGNVSAAAEYRELAAFQAGKRGIPAETDLLMEICDLNLLYAAGEMAAADEKARALRGTLSTANILTHGRQNNLLKMVDQALIYTKISAARGLDVSKDRPLPQSPDPAKQQGMQMLSEL